MYISAALQKTTAAVKAIFILLLGAALIVHSPLSRAGISSGLELCLKVLAPSLFPFMVFSSLAVKSGLCEKLGRFFEKPTKFLFGLNGSFAPVLLLSLVGGYPVGAKGISALAKEGSLSEKEAQRAAMFAVCAGPGFTISFVGASLCRNQSAGVIIMAAQSLSVIILGVILRVFGGSLSSNNKTNPSKITVKKSATEFSSALVEAVSDASTGMVNICAMVMIFSALLSVAEGFISDIKLMDGIRCLTEVCSAVSVMSGQYPLETIAFAVGFGGLCVHFQIFSALEDIKPNKFVFFVFRIIQGAVTAALTRLLTNFFPAKQAVFSSGVIERSGVYGGSVLSGAALVALSICFLFTFKRENAYTG